MWTPFFKTGSYFNGFKETLTSTFEFTEKAKENVTEL